MAKVADYLGEGWIVKCPACDCYHLFFSSRFSFNEDFEKPTFSPEMTICTGSGQLCKFDVIDGKLIYSSESSHDLSGKTVDMIDV